MHFKPFADARELVRTIGLKNNREWRVWSKSTARPEDIPSAPDKSYATRGWAGWGDFLGTGSKATKDKMFRSFKEAKQYAQSLKFPSRRTWFIWAKSDQRPVDIPGQPSKTYGDAWTTWGDFLGTGNVPNIERKFRPFEEARAYARSLNFKRKEDWSTWTKSSERPCDIPTSPSRTYAGKGWLHWKDWLITTP